MREIRESKVVRSYSRRELAEELGMNPGPTDEITVTSTNSDVTIVVKQAKETSPRG